MTPPHCPVHVGARMKASVARVPFEDSATGKAKRRSRVNYRCPIPGCPCVRAGQMDKEKRSPRECSFVQINPWSET